VTTPSVKLSLLGYALFVVLFVVSLPLIHSVEIRRAVDVENLDPVDDLPQIKSRGKIVAITGNNSINYFIYRGRPMGFHYELLREFASENDLALEMKVSSEVDVMEQTLLDGECDIIAAGLTVTRERTERMSFTDPILQSRQVLVQRKPEGWRKLSKKALEDSLLRNQLDLGGKTVFIPTNSSFEKRLLSLSDEIGDTIHIVEVDTLEPESMMELVANGNIDYTVADELEAMVVATYYPDLDVLTDVSYPQNLAWAVKPGADSLLSTVNSWLQGFMKTRKFKYIYKKYFVDQRLLQMEDKELHSRRGSKISPYDRQLKIVAAEFNWDWRLLASLMYQESHFNPDAVNAWSGAFGLMQLMPTTAEHYGITPTSPAEDQIRAGVKFLRYIDRQIPVEVNNRAERQKFILASYNSGPGHILDARRLAEKYDADPNVWDDNVEAWLLKKSESKYYRDPVVKNGYYRGRETVKFVKDVLARYEHYKNLTD